MEKYIKRSDLSAVMERVTDKAVEHADKITVDMCLFKFDNDLYFTVIVRNRGNKLESLVQERYIIIPDTLDDYDVMVETINEALKKIAEAEKPAVENTK